MKVLVLDNYDSFTYNIVHSLNDIENIDISRRLNIFKSNKLPLILDSLISICLLYITLC